MERHPVGRGTNSQTMGTPMQKVTPIEGKSTDLVSEAVKCLKALFSTVCTGKDWPYKKLTSEQDYRALCLDSAFKNSSSTVKKITILNQNGVTHVKSLCRRKHDPKSS